MDIRVGAEPDFFRLTEDADPVLIVRAGLLPDLALLQLGAALAQVVVVMTGSG